MQLIDPFPGNYDAADPFGNTTPPRTYPHTGSDWIVGPGTPIPAIGAGVVAGVQWHAGNGNTVTVKLDGSPLYYAYLHMQAPALVAVGQRVELGQILGRVGDTGTNSRGPHLHVTVSESPDAYRGLGRLHDPWALIQAHPATTPEEESTMPYSLVPDAQSDAIFVVSLISRRRHQVATPEHVTLLQRYKNNDGTDRMFQDEMNICGWYIELINPTGVPGGGLSDADRALLVKEINDDAARRMSS